MFFDFFHYVDCVCVTCILYMVCSWCVHAVYGGYNSDCLIARVRDRDCLCDECVLMLSLCVSECVFVVSVCLL